MRKMLVTLLVAALAVGCGGGSEEGGEGDLTPINVSYQPALYWSVPYYIASEEGWWEEMGLDPEFSTFASGAPQISAAASGDWDVGGTGSAPALLGAARYDILTVGITNDESAANVLMAREGEAEEFTEGSSAFEDIRILLTTNSTGEYAALSCLEQFGVSQEDIEFVNQDQGQILQAFSSGEGNLAGVWAPNNYTLQEQTGAEVICDGEEAGVTIPGNLVTRADYAEENPDLVARYLAVFLHAQEWMRDNPDGTIEYMEAFYSEGGVNIPEEYLNTEVETRPLFTLQEQLDLLSAEDGSSQVGEWYTGIGEYMQASGALDEVPEPADFVTDEYMQMVEEDSELQDFATSAEE